MIYFGVHKEDVFFDAGCAYNSVAAYMAQKIGLKAWGIEYVDTRNFMVTNLFLDALVDKCNIGPSINKRVALVPGNLFCFSHFGESTVVDCRFDNFEP